MREVVVSILGDNALALRLRAPLYQLGFRIVELGNRGDVVRSLQSQHSDVVIVGPSKSGAKDGLDIVRQIRRWSRRIPLVMVAENSNEDLAISALRAGINDYLKQPFSFDDLTAAIKRCLSETPLTMRLPENEPANSEPIGGHQMIGNSPAVKAILSYVNKVAMTDSNVLITGETGTGKEVAAELIHRRSPRQGKQFVCINCAALPDTLLESELFGYEKGAFTGAFSQTEGKLKVADGGTVFFDEIGDMSPYAQAKILRAIESKEIYRLGGAGRIAIDCRVIAATNADLEAKVKEGKFRKDLYFRLNVARIHLPPLRDRREDIPKLVDYYIRELNYQFGRDVEGLSDEVQTILGHYDYPGNIRELKNLLEAVFVNIPSKRIFVSDLPEHFCKSVKSVESPPQPELDRLLHALSSTNWNRSGAARKLHWSRMTLYRKMAKYHLVTASKKSETETTAVALQVVKG